MWNKLFSQLNLIRFGLAISAVAVILLILPGLTIRVSLMS